MRSGDDLVGLDEGATLGEARDGRKRAPLDVLFLLRSLGVGGTERQVVTLAAGLTERGCRVAVATFYPGGVLAADLAAAGVAHLSLGKAGRWDVAGFLARLLRLVRARRPDVVYGMLPVPNLAVLTLHALRRRPRLVWGVRATEMNLSAYDRLTRLAYGLEARLGRLADRIVVNAEAGRRHAIEAGLPAERLTVVANGIDTERFAPDAAARDRLRAEWGVTGDAPLLGLVARLDPIKDHATFLAAAAMLADRQPAARFVCVGAGEAAYAARVRGRAADLGLGDRVIWADERDDMPSVYSALDLLVLTSKGEGFPNVLAEAMACGVPCVSTDVGDAALIVGETGRVVPVGDTEALAAACEAMLAGDRAWPDLACRDRVERLWSRAAAAERTLDVLLDVCGRR